MTAIPSGRFGAILEGDGVLFQVWTAAHDVELIVDGDERSAFTDFHLRADGLREILVPGLKAGCRYAYRLEGQGPFPDPASRFQPDGVHAFSEVVDPTFSWTDHAFNAPPWRETVFYELHCGAFTPGGTFRAAAEKLRLLRDLGVTAVELMPVADFGGRWNWGYDGVALYAPSRNYGRPEDLRTFVNHAHELGLAVYLDVVYNHLGPDGAYHRLFHPAHYADGVRTPWGDGLNFHDAGSPTARAFFVDNGLHWLREYHIDGFRLDATHAIDDRSEPHFLAEFAAAIHECAEAMARPCTVVAEDSRNMVRILAPASEGGYAVDAVWADDFHHQVRRAVAGDATGYYVDYAGTPADIAETMRNGWFYDGQYSHYHGRPRGTPSGTTDRSRFVICIQNHDQIGNRAQGERLHHQVAAGSARAASALLLLAPETPLLFMGQEWSATSPFLYFTDHNAELGRLVTEGRRREFSGFPEFVLPESQLAIPDPQRENTFLRSKLRWEERTVEPHAATWRWYRRLLELRREVRAARSHWAVEAEDGALTVEWSGPADSILAVIALLGPVLLTGLAPGAHVVLSSEDAEFSDPPLTPEWDADSGTLRLHRAGCVVLKSEGRPGNG